MKKKLVLFLSILASAAFNKISAQIDLNDASTFYGYWEGKVTFKAFALTEEMNMEISKGKSPGFITLMIERKQGEKISRNTMQCKFDYGWAKLEFSTRPISGETDYCTGYLNLGLLDEKILNGSFEAGRTGCSSAEYSAVKKDGKGKDIIRPVNNETNKNMPAEDGEARLMQSCGGITRKNKSVIEMKLGNGKTVLLKNEYDGGDFDERSVKYEFGGCISVMEMYKFYAAYAETDGYLLVDKKDGTRYFLSNEPEVSPDNKKLVCVRSGEDDSGFYENYLEIWGFSNGKLKREYELKNINWGPAAASWKSNTTILVDAVKYDGTDINKLKPRTLSLVGNKWTLR